MGNFFKDAAGVLTGGFASQKTGQYLGLDDEKLAKTNPAAYDSVVRAKGEWTEATGEGEASQMMADLTREQWEDYKARFVLIEKDLMGYYDNPEHRAERIGAARGLSGKAFDTAEKDARTEASRYGLNLDSNPAHQRRLGLSRAAGDANAANATRQHLAERDQHILAGGLSTRGM